MHGLGRPFRRLALPNGEIQLDIRVRGTHLVSADSPVFGSKPNLLVLSE